MHYMAWTALPGTGGTNGNVERMVETTKHFMLPPHSRLDRIGSEYSLTSHELRNV